MWNYRSSNLNVEELKFEFIRVQISNKRTWGFTISRSSNIQISIFKRSSLKYRNLNCKRFYFSNKHFAVEFQALSKGEEASSENALQRLISQKRNHESRRTSLDDSTIYFVGPVSPSKASHVPGVPSTWREVLARYYPATFHYGRGLLGWTAHQIAFKP